ncbi:MAG: zincin-like metallopeptidase domain-containing protein [Promethearchaeota archaeon]
MTIIKDRRKLYKIYKNICGEIIGILEDLKKREQRGENVDWKSPWNLNCGLHANVMTPNRPYSIFNQLRCNLECLINGFSSTRWITEERLHRIGGSLKDESSLPTEIYGVFENKNYEREMKEYNKLSDEEKKKVRKPLEYFMRIYYVYNLDQCVLPENFKRRSKVNEDAEKIISRMKNKPEFKYYQGASYYILEKDEIHLPARSDFSTVSGYYSTLFHELAHATGHPKRLNRKTLVGVKKGFNDENYSKEELIAELTNAYLCALCGMTTSRDYKHENEKENIAKYILYWIKILKAEPQFLVVASNYANQAANYILGANVRNSRTRVENLDSGRQFSKACRDTSYCVDEQEIFMLQIC